MKRSPLIRSSGLRRSLMRPWRRDEDDKVTPELRNYILDRDRICIAARIDSDHQCRTRFGVPHAADDRRYLTLDHVHGKPFIGVLQITKEGGYGDRAPSDKYHIVVACGDANNNGWCSAHRREERSYLAEVEPE